MKTLSEKRYKSYEPDFHYKEEDVKEFIKKLKESFEMGEVLITSREKQIVELFKERIDKLAGEDLKWKN